MSSRTFIVQRSDFRAGWVDLENLTGKREKEVVRLAAAYAREHGCVTRVIRKSHGWERSSPPQQVSQPASPPVIVVADYSALEMMAFAEFDLVERKSEKKRRRVEAMKVREQARHDAQPTCWDRLGHNPWDSKEV